MKKTGTKVFTVFIVMAAATLVLFAGNVGASAQSAVMEYKNFSVILKGENTFLSYTQEGGVTDMDGASVDFDPSYAPRGEIGILFHRGLGIRYRYWTYNTNERSADYGGVCDVDTFSWDMELFQKIRITEKNEMEWAVGFRRLNFKHYLTGSIPGHYLDSELTAGGVTVALEAKRKIWYGKFYARGRFSILVGDSDIIYVQNNSVYPYKAVDNTAYQTELALGYELNLPLYSWGTLNVSAGGEWQNWSNIVPADTSFGGIGNDDVLEDVGFVGFVLGIGLEF